MINSGVPVRLAEVGEEPRLGIKPFAFGAPQARELLPHQEKGSLWTRFNLHRPSKWGRLGATNVLN